MRAALLGICQILGFSITADIAVPQSRQQKPVQTSNIPPSPTPTPEPAPDDVTEEAQPEVLKITTNLVTVPVIAATADGKYVPDLRQEEFSVSEDGVKQELAFFATVSAPFHVVLLLDTSASTQEKLGMIRRSAITFVEQLQTGDRVKVISFDDQVRDLNDFTNDRAVLRHAINQTEPGRGTKVYDAVELALSSIRKIEGRKAIVLFSDGMDWHSDRASFDGTLRWLEEEGVIVYPIRYDTRAETEKLARQQADEQTPQLPTRDVINRTPPGTTAPTFPSDDPDAIPTSGRRSTTGPFGLPSASEILRRKREADREADRERSGDNYPRSDRIPTPPDATRRSGDERERESNYPPPSGRGTQRVGDDISAMLDAAYLTADSYLMELANRSGGRVVRADTLASLPDAFAKIAAELRTQYAIGYYPTNKERDGKLRKIKVTSARKNVAIRARPGYRARRGG
jgi:hypothetical protein